MAIKLYRMVCFKTYSHTLVWSQSWDLFGPSKWVHVLEMFPWCVYANQEPENLPALFVIACQFWSVSGVISTSLLIWSKTLNAWCHTCSKATSSMLLVIVCIWCPFNIRLLLNVALTTGLTNCVTKPGAQQHLEWEAVPRKRGKKEKMQLSRTMSKPNEPDKGGYHIYKLWSTSGDLYWEARLRQETLGIKLWQHLKPITNSLLGMTSFAVRSYHQMTPTNSLI